MDRTPFRGAPPAPPPAAGGRGAGGLPPPPPPRAALWVNPLCAGLRAARQRVPGLGKRFHGDRMDRPPFSAPLRHDRHSDRHSEPLPRRHTSTPPPSPPPLAARPFVEDRKSVV